MTPMMMADKELYSRLKFRNIVIHLVSKWWSLHSSIYVRCANFGWVINPLSESLIGKRIPSDGCQWQRVRNEQCVRDTLLWYESSLYERLCRHGEKVLVGKSSWWEGKSVGNGWPGFPFATGLRDPSYSRATRKPQISLS